MAKRMFYYRVGVGYGGISLEYHLVKAPNELDARTFALRTYLHPDKGFDHVEAVRIPKAKAMLYKGFENCSVYEGGENK